MRLHACMHAWVVLGWGGAPPALLLYYFIILSLSRLGTLNSINLINFCWQQVLFVIDLESSHQSVTSLVRDPVLRACVWRGLGCLYYICLPT